jgi:hypothetical protein
LKFFLIKVSLQDLREEDPGPKNFISHPLICPDKGNITKAERVQILE